jgi:hypothetical protein
MIKNQSVSNPLMVIFDLPKSFLTEFDPFLAGLVKSQGIKSVAGFFLLAKS